MARTIVYDNFRRFRGKVRSCVVAFDDVVRTSCNKTGWTRIKGFTRVSSDSNDTNKVSITIRCNLSFEGTIHVSYFLLTPTKEYAIELL